MVGRDLNQNLPVMKAFTLACPLGILAFEVLVGKKKRSASHLIGGIAVLLAVVPPKHLCFWIRDCMQEGRSGQQ
jgi:hypothetical protein